MIIAILTVVAVPQYFKVVEKEKTAEAVDLFLTLKGAQDRYKSKYGAYCNNTVALCPGFDVTPPALHYFNPVGAFAAGGGGNQSWKLTLTRASAVAVYGAYQLTYDVEPGAAPLLTCNPVNPCKADLLPSPN